MPYITREDGEHFVIPSYRDVLTVSQKSQLKKEILLLSRSYGEYITLQKKTPIQYEVAFSADTGYLLGESIWHQFKKPLDMVYCEAIPNTTEAILVIVKAGSVYLDGRFPVEGIPEELIIFLTQQNNFEIYTYGNVPISKDPAAGKFSFEPASVKSFTVLDKPVFPTLPLLKMYQLQLVEPVLKAQGIGVFPTRSLVTIVIALAMIWAAYSYLTRPKPVVVEEKQVNPYQSYNAELNSPAPDEEISNFISKLKVFMVLPGWKINTVKYSQNMMTATVLSAGGRMEDLYGWAQQNKATMLIRKNGVVLSTFIDTTKRPLPKQIFSTPKVLAKFVDNMATVYPGNHLDLGDFVEAGVITTVVISIRLDKTSLLVLDLIGKQMKGLPIVLNDITATIGTDGTLNGSITIEVLGN
jgi:hypothetical protein